METKLSVPSDELAKLALSDRTSLSIEKLEAEYILDIAGQPSLSTSNSCKIAATSSNFTVRLYNIDNLGFICSIRAHDDVISGVRFSDANARLMFTASHDGTVRCWDIRVKDKCVQSFMPPSSRCDVAFSSLDVSSDGTIICAGSVAQGDDVDVVLWDVRRAGHGLRCFNESHTDDVTSVCFGAEQSLLSGSTDGLVCVYDLTQCDDDDALVGTLNTESSVSKLGFCGERSSLIYALTHVETLHLWQAQQDFDDVAHLTDIRSSSPDRNIDYLVDCFDCGHVCDRVCVLAGSNTGQGHLMSVQGNALQYEQSLCGGHNDVIRSMVWCAGSATLITGGEDATLCSWKPQDVGTSPQPAASKLKMKSSSRKHQRNKPF